MSTEILDQAEVNYLISLKKNPLWISVLKKITTYEKLPRYSSKLDKSQGNDQHSLWIYRSGGLDATDAIISLLSPNNKLPGVSDGK